ncbi:MAG: ABC transporter ATP-binding protein [Gammaproteobacteria bacterium]|jgi:zinc transport system ATP-binding protein
MSESIISIENVSFSYGGPLALENINLTVRKGEFLGVVGPNGGGKSTLLKLILGLFRPDAGKLTVLGKTPEKGREHIGYVPQHVRFNRDFPITVEDTILLGRLGKSKSLWGYAVKDKQLCAKVMQETEIDDLKQRRLNTLSGGQLQRVLIARALVSDPEILILDEPTANIDLRVEEDIFGLLKRLNERVTIIIVSHDIGFISEYVNRVACLNRTLLCHETSAISGKMIEDLYATPVQMIQHIH